MVIDMKAEFNSKVSCSELLVNFVPYHVTDGFKGK